MHGIPVLYFSEKNTSYWKNIVHTSKQIFR